MVCELKEAPPATPAQVIAKEARERQRQCRQRKAAGAPRLKPGPKPRDPGDPVCARKVVQNAEYYRRYRQQRAASGNRVRDYHRDARDIDAEMPGLKPPLTAEYFKCGFPEPSLEQFSVEVTEACKAWWKRRGLEEPFRTGATWDWAWIDRAVNGDSGRGLAAITSGHRHAANKRPKT
jgi:hypothetical protein